MIHLNIDNNNNVETVAPEVIDALYHAVTANDYVSGNLKGTVNTTYVYEDYKDYLTDVNRFPEFNIINQGYYVRFADSSIETLCVNNWGSGGHLTQNQASAVSSIKEVFMNNTDLTDASFLKYFTGVSSIADNDNGPVARAFKGCTNLQRVILPSSIQCVCREMFSGCTSLSEIDLQHVTILAVNPFSGCSVLVKNTSGLTNVASLAFNGTTNTVIELPALVSLGSKAFQWNTTVEKVDIGPNLTRFNPNATFQGASNLSTIIIRATTVPDLSGTDSYKFNGLPNDWKLYVPDTALNDYQTHSSLSSVATHIVGISQLPSS